MERIQQIIRKGSKDIKTKIKEKLALNHSFSTCSVSKHCYYLPFFKLGSAGTWLCSSGFVSLQLFLISAWRIWTEGNWPLIGQPAVTRPQNTRKPHNRVPQKKQQWSVSFLWFHWENVGLSVFVGSSFVLRAGTGFAFPRCSSKEFSTEMAYNYGWCKRAMKASTKRLLVAKFSKKKCAGRTCLTPREEPNAGPSSTGGSASLTQTFLTVAEQKDEAAYKPNVGPATTRRAEDRAMWASNGEQASVIAECSNKSSQKAICPR